MPANTPTPPDHSPGQRLEWFAAIAGSIGIAVVAVAFVWVLEGQVQHAQGLRAQWQGTPNNVATASTMDTNTVTDAGPTPHAMANQSALITTSFSR